jgi:CheY-like chemotaxis protein
MSIRSLTQTLEDQGFDVQQAASAAEALDRAIGPNASFDVVLLDFRLPDSNDLTLLARLRQLLPQSAVILMTAFSTPEIAQGGGRPGRGEGGQQTVRDERHGEAGRTGLITPRFPIPSLPAGHIY